MVPSLANILKLPIHLQSAAFLYREKYGKIPKLSTLYRHHGKADRVGNRDCEEHTIETLKLLRPTTIDPRQETPPDANFARYEAFKLAMGTRAAELLAGGVSISETARIIGCHRVTLSDKLSAFRKTCEV